LFYHNLCAELGSSPFFIKARDLITGFFINTTIIRPSAGNPHSKPVNTSVFNCRNSMILYLLTQLNI